jgi:hypothetical protein
VVTTQIAPDPTGPVDATSRSLGRAAAARDVDPLVATVQRRAGDVATRAIAGEHEPTASQLLEVLRAPGNGRDRVVER